MYHSNQDRMRNTEKFYGNYRGEVVAVNDPKDAGRIKVRVFGVFDDAPVDSIPWSIMADPLMGGQAGLGGFFVPDQGSHVWVFFEQGDHQQPVYFAGAPARDDGPSERFNGTYPYNHVFSTSQGHVIEIDNSPGANRLRIHHASGTEVEIDHAGNVDETVVGNVTMNVQGNVDETVQGNVTRTIQGDVTETVSGSYTRNTTGDVTETSSGNSTYTSSGTTKMEGATAEVTGSSSASVTGGASSVDLSSSTKINSSSVTHNDTEIGGDHYHSQTPDSDGNTQQDTSTPKSGA